MLGLQYRSDGNIHSNTNQQKVWGVFERNLLRQISFG